MSTADPVDVPGPGVRGASAGSCGPAFEVLDSPQPPPTGILEDVAAVSRDDAWAVGTDVEHWDGHAWTIVPSPNPYYLFGVQALAPDDAWAVGVSQEDEQTWVQHWDGVAWTRVPSPSPGEDVNELTDLDAISADDVWAGGFSSNNGGRRTLGLVEHWDGTSWQVVETPHPGGATVLQGIAEISASDVWAVGSNDRRTFAEHWDGEGWAMVPTPDPDGSEAFTAVVGLAGDDVWAVGYAEDNTRTLVEHWDGHEWRWVNSPPAGRGLFAVDAASPRDIWATSVQGMDPLVEHYDGKAWRVVSTPVKEGRAQLRQSGVGVVPGTGEVWLVGFATPSFTTLKERLCATRVLDSGFAPSGSAVRRGMSAAWTIPTGDSSSHTVTDGTGMGWFDSGLRAPGTTYVVRFFAAGTYPVIDKVTSHVANVSVPSDAMPRGGGPDTTFTVAWASADPPAGFVFDVQILRPGAPEWSDWRSGVTQIEDGFLPDAGSGSYAFRARLRNAGNGASSDWSPAASIEVSED